MSKKRRPGGWKWSWSGSKKDLVNSSVEQRRRMIELEHPKLSVSKQCELLGPPRSSFFFRPRGATSP